MYPASVWLHHVDVCSNTNLSGNFILFMFKVHWLKGTGVKVTLVQALRLCTGRTADRGSRDTALLFLDHGTRRGVRDQRHAPAALYPRERTGIYCTGGWVDLRAGLDRWGKSRLHRYSIPRDRPARSQSLYWQSYPAHLSHEAMDKVVNIAQQIFSKCIRAFRFV